MSERTNPSVVIGSSSSGSTTAPNAAYANSCRLTSRTHQIVGAARTNSRLSGCRQLQLGRHRDVIHLGGVEAEDLLLLIGGDLRVLTEVVGNLEVDERLHQPTRRPDRVVRRELDPVLADPVQQLPD